LIAFFFIYRLQMSQVFNLVSDDFILVGPEDHPGSYFVPEEPRPLVSHLVHHLERQLRQVEGLGQRPWLINFLTNEQLKFGEIIPKIKR
jgi:hypothetical protein